MGCVGVAGHDCERTARRGAGQCMAPPPQARGTGNAPLHICRGRPHSLCGRSKPAVHLVPDNHLIHLKFIDLTVCKHLSHPFYMQHHLGGYITSNPGFYAQRTYGTTSTSHKCQDMSHDHKLHVIFAICLLICIPACRQQKRDMIGMHCRRLQCWATS